MRLEVVAVALQDVLGFEDSVANAAGAGVKLRQGGVQVIGVRIVLDGETIFVNRLVGVVGAAVHRDHLLVHVRQGEVIVGRGLVGLLRRRTTAPVGREQEDSCCSGASACGLFSTRWNRCRG